MDTQIEQIPSNPAALPTNDLVGMTKAELAAVLSARDKIQESTTNYCERVWQLGRLLWVLRDRTPHGQWSLFLTASFPDLGETEKTRRNRAKDAIDFFTENPEYPESGHFTEASLRKCIYHLAPEKTRPQLPGDERFTPSAHHLNFVNDLAKWDRQVGIGIATAASVDVLQREFEPAVRLMVKHCGREWLAGLLEEAA